MRGVAAEGRVMGTIFVWRAHGRCVAPSRHAGAYGNARPSNVATSVAAHVATLAVFATHLATFAAKWPHRWPQIPLNPGDSAITHCKSSKNGNVDRTSQLYRLNSGDGLMNRRSA